MLAFFENACGERVNYSLVTHVNCCNVIRRSAQSHNEKLTLIKVSVSVCPSDWDVG